MDKALKQRMVGASVLIALAVIVLPMMLGGPPESMLRQSRKIDLPPRPDDVAFETRRFPLGERNAERPASVGEVAGADRLHAPSLTEEGAAAEPATEPAAVADAPARSPQAAAPTARDSNLPPPQAKVEPAPAVEILQPGQARAPTAPAASSAGRYVVQVASLGSDANARKLMETLQQSGFPVLLDTIESDGGRLSRVRVGPYDSESAADSAIDRIRETVEGVTPRLVDLSPDAASPVTHPADPLVRWVVQVGSFSDAANADGLIERLRAGGLSAYRETVTSSGGSIHRVRVGPFLAREDALSAQRQLHEAHALEGVVMSAD